MRYSLSGIISPSFTFDAVLYSIPVLQTEDFDDTEDIYIYIYIYIYVYVS